MLRTEGSESTILNLSGKEKAERDRDIAEHSQHIMYSRRYYDDEYEYRYLSVRYESFNITRHVILPKQLAKYVPANALLTETEWRAIGVQQSPGWVHYMVHNPEPHILLFRREKDYQTKYPNGEAHQ